MKAMLAVLLLCAGCAARPAPPVLAELPPPDLPEPPPRPRHVAKPEATGHDSPAAVLHDSASLADQTYRYVESDKAQPENIKALTVLKGKLDGAVWKLRQQRHPTAEQVAATRAAAEAMAAFFRQQQD